MNTLLKDPNNQRIKELSKYALGIYIGYSTFKYLWWFYKNNQLKAKSRRARQQRDSKLYAFKDIPQTELILSLDVSQMREHLLKGTFTSVDLVDVFGQRCQTIGRQLCLTTEENFEDALRLAEIRDNERKEAIQNNTTTLLPPLHGIPISIKDIVKYFNFYQYSIYRSHKKAIQQLQDANIYVNKSMKMMPQLLSYQKKQEQYCLLEGIRLKQFLQNLLYLYVAFAIHTDNKIWGCSKNPWDITRSCGGSSGGDGGLVAAKCTPLAIGSDIGGSIRVPCSFNGVRGFKSTGGRTSIRGCRIPLPDSFTPFNVIKASIGPIGQSVEDLITIFKIQLHPNINHYDPNVQPTNFNEELYEKARNGKIRVGYFDSLPSYPSSNAVRRGMQIAKQALEDQGFEVVPFNYPSEIVNEVRDIYMGLIANYFLGPLMKNLEKHYEKPIEIYKLTILLYKANLLTRTFMKTLLILSGNRRIVEFLRNLRPMRQGELDNLIKRRDELMWQLKEKWQEAQINALICPPYLSCAFKSQNAGDMGGMVDYTILWNTFNYPSGVIPVTRVQQGEDDQYEDGYNDIWTKLIRKDLQGSQGMPISIQVVSYIWEDEVCLGVMKAIDDQVKFNEYPVVA